jgi:hypothetical protein
MLFSRQESDYVLFSPEAQLCYFIAQSPAMLSYRPKPSYAVLSPEAQLCYFTARSPATSNKVFLVFPCFEASAELQASKASLPI